MISDEVNPNRTSTGMSGDVLRYTAIEFFNEGAKHSKASDTYSFAMLILECITENPPFPHLSKDHEIISARFGNRQNPPRPDGPNNIPDDLWGLMERCWKENPRERPTMRKVLGFFVNHT